MMAQPGDLIERAILEICRDVCELPDRSSPEGEPDQVIVTLEELSDICRNVLTEALAAIPIPATGDVDHSKLIGDLRTVFGGESEGWTKNSKYQTMPEVMLRYRSAAFLVRFYAPDVMLGYQTVDEIIDVVAAASPSAELLTGQMLIEQSQPAVLAAVPYDPETGEIIEQNTTEATGTAREAPSAEESTSAMSNASTAGAASEETPAQPQSDAMQHNQIATADNAADAPHPAQARATLDPTGEKA